MTICRLEQKNAGKSYPRTCPTCGIGGKCIKELQYDQLLERIEAFEKYIADPITNIHPIKKQTITDEEIIPIVNDYKCYVCGMVFKAGHAYGYVCSNSRCPIFVRVTS